MIYKADSISTFKDQLEKSAWYVVDVKDYLLTPATTLLVTSPQPSIFNIAVECALPIQEFQNI